MEYYSKKPNKIREIVRLQQILKKWRKCATSSNSSSSSSSSSSSMPSSKQPSAGKKHFSDKTSTTTSTSTAASEAATYDSNNVGTTVPKGCLAVCVGEEQKRFVVPTEYLARHAFHVLLREAEEEFGFEQMGVLRIPCEVSMFESVLKMVQEKRDQALFFHEYYNCGRDGVDHKGVDVSECCSSIAHC